MYGIILKNIKINYWRVIKKCDENLKEPCSKLSRKSNDFKNGRIFSFSHKRNTLK